MIRIVLVLLITVSLQAAVIVSTSANCSSPPSPALMSNDASSSPVSASAMSNLNCIFGGENTGFANALAQGSISGATQLNLSVMGQASADTGFLLVPGRENAAQGSTADMSIVLNLLVTGGAANGILTVGASQCEMLAGAFGEFRVNGAAVQSLAGCGVGTQVMASYNRDVPFQIEWFIHAEALSTIDMEADDVGRLTFDDFSLSDPDASLTRVDIPEPSTLLLVGGALMLMRRRIRR